MGPLVLAILGGMVLWGILVPGKPIQAEAEPPRPALAIHHDSPYRTELEVIPEQRERSFCTWCRFERVVVWEANVCRYTPHRSPSGKCPKTQYVNPEGRCEAYTPTRLTRLSRRFGRRQPIMLEHEPPKPPKTKWPPAPCSPNPYQTWSQ